MNFERLDIDLPDSFTLNRRRLFKRSEIEHLKSTLVAKAMGQEAPQYVPPEVESFVDATRVAEELGISRRTIARRINEAEERRQGAAA